MRQPAMNAERLSSPQHVLRTEDRDSVGQMRPEQGSPSREGLTEGPRKGKSPIAAGFEAQTYFKKELAQNHRLGAYEREIPEVAINLIPQVGGSRHDGMDGLEQPLLDSQILHDPSMYPFAETMCFLSIGKRLPI